MIQADLGNISLYGRNRVSNTCLLYTSDAADDLLCVDLGGRRIIKKKKTTNTHMHTYDTYNKSSSANQHSPLIYRTSTHNTVI